MDPSFRCILVPVDGSEAGDRAVEYAFHLAEETEATIHALHVVDTRLYGDSGFSTLDVVVTDVEDRGAEILADVVTRGEEHGVPVETRSCHGVPDEEIATYAREIDADIVVMGFQGETHTTKIGSTADHVLRELQRPVLTV